MAKFLSNKQNGKDLFEEQPQEKIACAIAEVIKNDTSARRIIGLEGEWGSGKSNVVGILQDNLQKHTTGKGLSKHVTHYKYLVYDLWTHQTDDVRKTLLRTIVNDLCGSKIIDSSWEEKTKLLFATKRETQEKSRPRFNVGMVCTALMLITAAIYATFTAYDEKSAAKVSLCFMLIWTAIVVFNILWNITCFLKHNFNKKTLKPSAESKHQAWNWTVNIFSYLFSSIGDAFAKSYSIFAESNLDKETEQYEYEEVATSDGFQREIGKIDEEIKASKHHYIIVLDNFDRVQPEKVQELWATLITLFGEAQYKAITILVPFERTHVQDAFKHGDNENEAEDFINKTFSCVFRVAQPTMSTWKRFFAAKWLEAFGTADNGDIQMLFELLEPHITPRSIIAFINKVVTIQLWADKSGLTIPHKYMALYALQQKDIVKDGKVVDNILNETYLGNADFLFKDDIELSRYILGLHYQLNPQKALDIIFVSKLRKAFDENLQGAEIYLGMENWRQLLQSAIKEVNNVPQTALMLGELLKVKADEDTTQLWDALYGRLNSKEKNYKEYQKAFYGNISESKRRTYLNQIVNNYHPTEEEAKSDDFNSAKYIKSLQALESFVLPEDHLKSRFKPVELSPVKFLDAVTEAGNKIGYYDVACPEDKLDEHLASLAETDYIHIDYLPYLINNDYELVNFKQSIKDNFNAHLNSQSSGATYRFPHVDHDLMLTEVRLLSYFDDKPLGAVFSPLFLQHYFPNIDNNEHHQFYILFLAQLITYEVSKAEGNLESYKGNPFDESDEQIALEVAQILPEHISLNQFFARWAVYGAKPLVANIAKFIIETGTVIDNFDIADFSDSYKNIQATTGLDHEIIMQFANKSKHGVTIEDIKNISTLVSNKNWTS